MKISFIKTEETGDIDVYIHDYITEMCVKKSM